MALFEPIFAALNHANVRYVLVGGLATVLHGYARLTADVDLILDLEPAAARQGMATLTGLGFRPRAPVAADDFADPSTRASWIHEKGMRVFSLWDPARPMCEVDVFVEHPVPFDGLFERAEYVPLTTTTVRVASIPDLVTMKRIAGRPQDLQDVAALEAILRARGTSRG